MRLLVAVRAPAVARGLGAEVRGEVAPLGEGDAGRGLRELGGRAAAGALGALPDERGLLRAGDRLHRLLGVGDVVEERLAGGGLLEGLRLLLELRVDERLLRERQPRRGGALAH